MATMISTGVPQRRFGGGSRTAAALAVFLVTFALVVGIVASSEGIRLTAPPLTTSLKNTIDTEGTGTALARYRALRERGFPGFSESEVATNDLAYGYLQAGRRDVALALLQVNAETHPASANVYDSLGEAYAAIGKRELAIAEYRRAASIDPDLKTTGIALQKLAGVPRKMISPLGVFHATAALTALLFGTFALVFRKGSKRHRWTGDVYVIAMLCMAGAGGYLASVKAQPSNVLAASLTAYLIVTGWAAMRLRKARQNSSTGRRSPRERPSQLPLQRTSTTLRAAARTTSARMPSSASSHSSPRPRTCACWRRAAGTAPGASRGTFGG